MLAKSTITRRVAFAGSVAATAVLVAACGGKANGGGAVDAGGLTGEPIKVAVIGDVTSQTGTSYSGIPKVIELAASKVNKEGGIGGRPIELVMCDLQGQADQASRCARSATSDKVAVALVQASFGQDKIPAILEPAKTAYMPAFSLLPADLNSPVSFPMAAGVLTQIGGAYVAAKYCKDPVLVTIQTPSTKYMTDLVKLGSDALGAKMPRIVTAPLGATDYAPTAAQATSGNPDCIMPYMSETLNTAFYPALKQTGWKEKTPTNRLVGYQGGVYTQKIFENFPDLVDNMAAVDMSYPFTDERWSEFNTMIKDLQKQKLTNLTSSFTKGSYLNFQSFVEVAKAIAASGGTVNNETVLAQFRKETDLSAGGLLKGVDTSKNGPVGEFPRMMNTNLIFEEVQNGKITMLNNGQFVDIGAEIQKAAG